jgi:hypothetical protein
MLALWRHAPVADASLEASSAAPRHAPPHVGRSSDWLRACWIGSKLRAARQQQRNGAAATEVQAPVGGWIAACRLTTQSPLDSNQVQKIDRVFTMGVGKFLDGPEMTHDTSAPRRKHSLMWLMHRGVDPSIVPAPTASGKSKRRHSKKQRAQDDAALCHDTQRRGRICRAMDAEAAELKRRIRDKVHRKFMYFDFLLLQRVTDAPVAIPAPLAQPGARSTVVAGKCVPITHAMWNTQKHEALARIPPRISE